MASHAGWLGILKWSLSQSDGTREASDFQPMSEEDKRWLAEAMESMTVDEAKRMRELAAALAAPATASADLGAMDGDAAAGSAADEAAATAAKLAALDELSDLVESIDNAKNLFMVGGVAPLLHCVAGANDALRRRAAEVLATVVKNNPRAQGWAREGGATLRVLATALEGAGTASEHLLQQLQVSTANVAAAAADSLSTRAALVAAMSALVRDNASGQRDLLRPLPTLPAQVGTARTPLGLLLQPVAEWPRFAPSSSPAAPLPPAVVRAGRRLVRKSLFALRSLVTGAQADAVMAAVLLFPRYGSASAEAGEPAVAGGGGGGGGSALVAALLDAALSGDEDVDVADVRENALNVLLSLVQPTSVFSGVIDDSRDDRQPRSLFAGEGSDAEAAAAVLRPTSLALLADAPRQSLSHASNGSSGGGTVPAMAASLFKPEDDWKRVTPGQRLPAGLDVRLDLGTGEQWARRMPAEDRHKYRVFPDSASFQGPTPPAGSGEANAPHRGLQEVTPAAQRARAAALAEASAAAEAAAAADLRAASQAMGAARREGVVASLASQAGGGGAVLRKLRAHAAALSASDAASVLRDEAATAAALADNLEKAGAAVAQ